MKKQQLAVFVLVSTLFFQFEAVAQSRRKTVGDLLNQIDKQGANVSSVTKSSVNLPTTRDIEAVKPKNLSSIKPLRTKQIMDSSKETSQLEAVIDEGIEELFKLTQKYKNSPNRGELWLRLGELYVEKAKLIEFRTYEEYDKQLSLYYDKKRKNKPKLDLRISKDFNKKAIQLYEWFIRDYPKDRKVDQALFFLGYNHFQVGTTKKGAGYFEELNERFPRSRYVSESNFSLGEYYFEGNKWKQAEVAYEKVIQRKDDRLMSFALYKKAWALHRMGQTQQGLKYLERVVNLGDKDRQKIRLVSEAQRDMVVFFSVVGNYEGARRYLSKYIDDKDLDGALEKLGFIYVEYGKRDAIRYTFNDLITTNPRGKKAVDYKFQIVNAYSTAGDRKVYIQELKEFMADYAPGSSWADSNPESVAASEELREKFVRNHSLQNHKIYLKNKSALARNMAMEGYKLYLKYFPTAKAGDEVHFFYAELLYDQNQFDDAATEYDWVVKNAKGSQYYDKALNNMLISLEKGLPSEDKIREKIGDSTERFAFPAAVQKFVTASSDFISAFSDKNKKAEIRFRVGRLHYLFNQFDEAEKIFKEVIAEHPKSKFAGFSANLILDIYNLKKDYVGLAAAGEALMADPSLKNSDALKDVSNVLEKASFKKAQDLEIAKNYLGSAKEFQNFSVKYPKSSLRVSAEYNAAVNFERAGEFMLALAMYSNVAKSKGKGNQKEVANSLLLQANLFQKIGRYVDAARSFEDYAKENPKDPKLADIYYNAATIWEALNNSQRAINNYEAYFKTSRKADKSEAIFKIALIQLDKKQYSAAINSLKQFIASSGASKDLEAEAHYLLADTYAKMSDDQKAFYWYRQLTNNFKGVSGKAVRFYAEAKLRITILDYNVYTALKFPNDPNQQSAVLNRKLDLLNKLNSSFTEIVKLNSGPQIISSLTWLGKSNEHFADAIDGAAKPKGLTAEEMKAYEDGIKQVTAPRRQTAIELYKQAYNKSIELDFFNADTVYAYDALARNKQSGFLSGKDFSFTDAKIDAGDLQ
jgi:TolA-binding protein